MPKRSRTTSVPTRTKQLKRPKTSSNQKKAGALNRAFPRSNTKYWDYYQSPVDIINGSAIMQPCTDGLIRGTSSKQYVGTQVVPLAVEFRWEFAPATTNTNPCVRLVLMQAVDQTFNAVIPDPAKAVEDVNRTSSPFQFEFKDSILVHRDHYGTASYALGPLQGKSYIKKKKLIQMQFADDGSITMGRFFVICWSDAANATVSPKLRFWFRLYFKDSV